MFVWTHSMNSCPNCKKRYSFRILSIFWIIKLGSRIGPGRVTCSSCKTEFDAGLTEWHFMTNNLKLRYWVISILYAIALGWTFALPATSAIGVITNNNDPNFPPNSLLIKTSLSFSFVVLMFQLYRIFRSKLRTQEEIVDPPEISFFSWETNLHFYGLVFGIICIISFILFFPEH